VIYDITQPLFECCVYPGDPMPEKTEKLRIARGDICNLTAFSMCAHNGTHVDAPFHFLNDGLSIDQVSLEKFIGLCYLEKHDGDVTAEDATAIMHRAAEAREGAQRRILLGGKATMTIEAARVFAEAGVDLIGNESQTVGPENAPMAVHLVLLGADVVLLEGIRVAHVPDGVYFLNCAPLRMTETDGSPCRAVLMDGIN